MGRPQDPGHAELYPIPDATAQVRTQTRMRFGRLHGPAQVVEAGTTQVWKLAGCGELRTTDRLRTFPHLLQSQPSIRRPGFPQPHSHTQPRRSPPISECDVLLLRENDGTRPSIPGRDRTSDAYGTNHQTTYCQSRGRDPSAARARFPSARRSQVNQGDRAVSPSEW